MVNANISPCILTAEANQDGDAESSSSNVAYWLQRKLFDNHGIELTIIIVNWNTADYLEKLLFSIFEKIIGDFYQVLVVDNDSKDGSREMVHEKFPGVILVNTGANLGYGKANNIGIKMARTPYILLLNPDTLVNSDAVPVMLDFLKSNDKIGAVQCALTDPDGTIQEMGLQWFDSPFTQFLTLFFIKCNKTIFADFLQRQDLLRTDISSICRRLYHYLGKPTL